MRRNFLACILCATLSASGCTASDWLFAIHDIVNGSSYRVDRPGTRRLEFEEHYQKQLAAADEYYGR